MSRWASGEALAALGMDISIGIALFDGAGVGAAGALVAGEFGVETGGLGIFRAAKFLGTTVFGGSLYVGQFGDARRDAQCGWVSQGSCGRLFPNSRIPRAHPPR